MFEQIPSYFDINISFFILLIIGIASGLFAYYQYKRTVPPISKFLQITLGIIRGSAFACILLLVFTPEFTAIWQRSESRKLIVAIDKSASMGIVENNQSRLGKALNIAEQVIENTDNRVETVIYGFDTDTTIFPDLLIDTTSLGTNLDKSLGSILDVHQKSANLVLITDGNFSFGDNPLYADYLDRVNIFSVGIGDTIDIPDIMISEVKSNKIVYQNQATQIQVFVMSRGIDRQKLNLSMKQNGRVLQVKELQIQGEGATVVSEFELVPEKVGLNQLDFSVQLLEGEAISQNNNYTISMEVLKGKIEVGLLASKPGYDTKFLKQLLSDQDDINFHMSIRTKRGKYYPSNPIKFLDSLDVLVLHDFPPSGQPDQSFKQYLNRVKSRRVPVLIIFSEAINRSQIESTRNFFPLKSSGNSDPYDTQVQLSIGGNQLPLLSIFDDDEIQEKFWNICPPIQYSFSQITFDSPVRELLQTRNSGNNSVKQPVLVAHEKNGQKGILLLGSGFWRWRFLLSEDKTYANSWERMFKNLIRWLDTGTVDKNVILSTTKKNFQVGDNIILTTQVYDGSFKYVNDGLIRTKVSGPSVSFEIESTFIENGRYEGIFVPLVPGKYTVRSEAWRNNINLGNDEIELIVTTVNREFLSTKQNHHFLNRLSAKTGGRYFREDETDDLVKSLNLKPELIQERETIELWNRLPFLLIIIFLLSLEWFIRKKKDLA